MDEQFVIHPYSEIPFRNKNNEQVIYATTCINLKGVNLSKKKSLSQKITYSLHPFTWHFRKEETRLKGNK